jgi:DNA-binding MarR family transcriptional regulator
MFMEECAQVRLTPIQCGIMTVVASAPGSGYSAIAKQLGIDRSNVANVLRRLLARGWVLQRTGGADRRKKRVWLSASGQKLLSDFEGRIQRSQDRLLVPLSKAQRKAFLAMILTVVEHNNEVSRAPMRMPDGGY